jgi:hypothetical protein
MRLLALGAAMSALTTFVTAMALRAADATLAVLTVASLTVLLTWYARLHTDDEHPSLGLVNPASATTLAAVGRRSWATMLPILTGHGLGAVVGGLAALGLADQWGDPLIFDADSVLVAGVGAAVVGFLVAWATLALDASGPDALAAVPVVVAGGIMPLGLVGAFSPAVVVGLAAADLLTWDIALVAAGAGLAAAAVGGWVVGFLIPAAD